MTDPNKAAAIDSMVAALSNAGADLTSPVKQGHAGVQYNSADDSFEVKTAAPVGSANQPLYDDGSRDLRVERDQLVANYETLVARLNEGKFDPVTGEKKFTVTGREREILEIKANQAKISGAYGIDRLQQIYAQRVQGGQENAAPDASPFQLANGQTVSLQDAAARAAFVDSAPPGQRVAYGAEFDRLMNEGRTRSVVDAIAAARRSR
jgi:hypothetical protein